MNKDEQNIAIAQAIGWRWMRDYWQRTTYREKPFPNGTNETISEIPDYTSDLNAMREAEGYLTGDTALVDQRESNQCLVYTRHLMHMTGERRKNVWHENQFFILRATAEQKAEAFLRTIGEWK